MGDSVSLGGPGLVGGAAGFAAAGFAAGAAEAGFGAAAVPANLATTSACAGREEWHALDNMATRILREKRCKETLS